MATDASDIAIAAVLSQVIDGRERPIVFYSRSLRKYEKNFTISEKEALAVVVGCQVFDAYLHGQPFTLLTDHSALKQIFDNRNTSPRLTRWALALQHLPMVVRYKKGVNNGNADALSRMQPSHVAAITRALPTRKAITKAQQEDEWLRTMIEWVRNKQLPADTPTHIRRQVMQQAENYFVMNDTLYYAKGGQPKRLVIPTPFTKDLIIEFHDAPWGGHFGAQKTLSRIERFYFWRGMHQQITSYCAKCLQCQLRKSPTTTTKQPLTPWPTVPMPLARVSVDTYGPVRMSKHGNTVVLVVTDFLSRFVWAMPLPDQKASTLARALVTLFLQIGFPSSFVSDAGTNFLSSTLEKMCEILQIEKYALTPLNHKGNGLVERFMRTLADGISQYIQGRQEDWCEFVAFIVFAHNSAIQRSVNESPFYLMFHRDPRLPLDTLLDHDVSCYQEDMDINDRIALNFRLAWQNAERNLAHTQQEQKMRYDVHTTPSKIEVGSRVFIRDASNKPNVSNKLTYKFRGPFRCVKVEGNNIWLTSINQPNAKPFRWNADYAKLARIGSNMNNGTAKEAHDLPRDTGCTSKKGQGQQKSRSSAVTFPIDQPAEHKHFLRSKARRTAEQLETSPEENGRQNTHTRTSKSHARDQRGM